MRGSISVLYVDDDGDTADLAAASLQRASADISVDHVESGAEAIEYLRNAEVDCVLSDYDVGDRPGLELLEAVRAEYPDLPYVLVSGEDVPEVAERALEAGATDYVRTDADPAVYRLLANRIENAVGARNGSPAAADTDEGDLAEEVPDGIVAIDGTETVREVNGAAAAIFDAAVEDLVGRSLPELTEACSVGDDLLSKYREGVEALRAGDVETAQVEFEANPGGDTRIYEARIRSRVRDGAFAGTVGTVRDVTAHREREDELQRYETLLRTIPDTVVMTDVEGNHLEVHGFEGWSGYTREELLDTNISETMPEEHLEKTEEVAVELFQDEEREKATFEMEVETRDGRRIPFENHLRLLPPDEDGMVPGTMSVLRNIEDRKERERQLSALNETMRELVTAASPGEVAHLVVDASRDILGFEINTVAYYDEEAGHLEPVASSAAAEELLGDIQPFEPGESLAWETFETGEMRAYEDVGAEDDAHNPETSMGRELICPLGEYGVLLLGSTTPGEFEDRDMALAEILAGNVEAALDRAFHISELEARELELEQYETAVESTLDGVALMNDDSEILLVNSVFADSMGYSREELVGESFGDFVVADRVLDAPADIEERFAEVWGEAHEEGTAAFRYEATLRDDDGSPKITDNRVTGIKREDDTVVFVIVSRDVTEQKERQEQIERLHESTRDLMAAETKDGVARKVVEAVETTLGFPANVVRMVDDAGEHLEPVAVTDPAREMLGDRSAIPIEGHALGEAFQAGETLLWDDLREHVDVDDDSDVRSLLSIPIGDYGLLSIVDDEVDAYDEADVRIAAILTSNAEAAFDRVEKEEALRARERALSRQIDRLDQFASIVSHDLRNPLNVAKGHLTFVEEQVEDTESVEEIERAHDRMQAIIEDVLTLAREGDEATEVEPIGLRQTVDTCWGNVDTKEATLEVDTDRVILADESRLQQLFENLLRNGLDHVSDDVVLRVGDIEGGFYLEDDGPGIPEEDREEVFETGFSTSREGTGFGLNIVKTIAEAHEWEVSVTEGSDGGARFEFTGVDFADV